MTHTGDAWSTDMLIDLLRRAPLLQELQNESLDRRDLQDRLNISRATSYRHCRLLEDLGVIEKSNGEYRLTDSGILLTDTLIRFEREATTALELNPILEAVRDVPVDIELEVFTDAVVTSAEHGDPYGPVARFVSLIEETEALRGFDMDVIVPLYIDEIQQRIVDGMETEAIAVTEVTRNILESYPEKCFNACASGNLTVKLHDDLPFGLVIFDHRVGIGVYEPGTRVLRTFADTDSPEVREWAEAVYELYDAEAVLMEEFTSQGFAQAMDSEAKTM